MVRSEELLLGIVGECPRSGLGQVREAKFILNVKCSLSINNILERSAFMPV